MLLAEAYVVVYHLGVVECLMLALVVATISGGRPAKESEVTQWFSLRLFQVLPCPTSTARTAKT
jgi:hypothetical protein